MSVCGSRTTDGPSAYVYTYVDGSLVNKTAMVESGGIDTFELPFNYASPRVSQQPSWALNIGQDGTGVYFDKGGASAIGARIDDLGLWRRALGAEEAKAIHTAGLKGINLSQAAVPPRLFVVPSINWYPAWHFEICEGTVPNDWICNLPTGPSWRAMPSAARWACHASGSGLARLTDNDYAAGHWSPAMALARGLMPSPAAAPGGFNRWRRWFTAAS